jgi:hypothetical protein
MVRKVQNDWTRDESYVQFHCKWGRCILEQTLFFSYELHWDMAKEKIQHVHWVQSHLGDTAKESGYKY